MISITDNTLEILHREYNVAVCNAKTITDIPYIMYQNLMNVSTDIPQADLSAYLSFMDGLKNCYRERLMTFEMTDFVTELNSVIMYVIRWLNDAKHSNIDINWYARRKALESDLIKILNKSLEDNSISVNIRDRFGLRGILLNPVSPEESIEKIDLIFQSLRDILARESPSKESFVHWYKTVNMTKMALYNLETFLFEIPFAITDVKDYIHNPKPNGYQSLQFTLHTSIYSPVLPGVKIEFQLRDIYMHNRAEGSLLSENSEQDQSHASYKNEIDDRISNVFKIDDFSKVSLPGFVNYEDMVSDRDGLHYPKHFSDRRSR